MAHYDNENDKVFSGYGKGRIEIFPGVGYHQIAGAQLLELETDAGEAISIESDGIDDLIEALKLVKQLTGV